MIGEIQRLRDHKDRTHFWDAADEKNEPLTRYGGLVLSLVFLPPIHLKRNL